MHPDNGGDPDEMTAINNAWDILGNPDKKHEYDQQLDLQSHTATPSDPTASYVDLDDDIDPDDPFNFKNWQPDLSHFTHPDTATTTGSGDNQPDPPALAFFGSFLAGVAMATLGVIWVIAIIIAGLIHHDTAASICENVFAAVLIFIATAIAISMRVRRLETGLPPFYALVVVLLIVVGVVLHAELTGWGALTWALLTVCCAEGERYQRIHALKQ